VKRKCEICDGNGAVEHKNERGCIVMSEICSACHGRGWTDYEAEDAAVRLSWNSPEDKL